MSNVQRKNVEAMALDQDVAPRTLQRFLESIVWDEGRLRVICRQLGVEEGKIRYRWTREQGNVL